jgi:hypothetical protein
MVSEADVPLVRLPRQLSDAVDEAVKNFIKYQKLEAHCRWQDTDLWVVYQDGTTTVNNKPVILQTRVTVAAFAGESGFEPDIVFTPDILLIAPEGRYILPEGVREQGQDTILLQRPQTPSSLSKAVTTKLEASWGKASDLAQKPEAASVFLHSGGYRELRQEGERDQSS